jgi:hypothetical protein
VDTPIGLLPEFDLRPGTPASDHARAHGLATFREAADRVWRLPYGRTSDRANPFLVLEEGRGTCSTKHALLKLLALEHDVPVEQVLGVYLMTEANTPGVGQVLDAHGLSGIPEAHCYLRVGDQRIDLTHPPDSVPGEPIGGFLHEEAIEPGQIAGYKTDFHRRFIERWLAEPGAPDLTPDEAWAIREACIRALGE